MHASLNHSHRWGVILGGGDGLRLRPLTRLLTGDDRPKQFCRLVGRETLLARTRSRVAHTICADRTLFLLAKAHEPFYAAELAGVPERQMIVQPVNRGTLPAILWSLLRLVQLDKEAVVGFFPSDHHYANEKKFVAKVTAAFAEAETAQRVILLGAEATAPEVEYGWIEAEPPSAGNRLLKVRRFWEKPCRLVAEELLDRGCLWNTFVMVGRAGAFLELVQSAAADLYQAFQSAFLACKPEMNPVWMESLYAQIEAADFSKQVLSEPSEGLAVLNLGDVGWNDLGDPSRVRAVLDRARHRRPLRQTRVSAVASIPATAN